MSSQGPSTGTSTGTGATGCYGNTQNSQVPRGYQFSTVSIRDGSDWIAYKKQARIFKDNKTKVEMHSNQWAQFGNDYRIQWQLGQYKCEGCNSTAFVGDGPTIE